MDGNTDATLSAVMEAIDWGTAATVTNGVCAAGIALATWGLLRATKRLVHETRRQAALAEAEADAKEQPDVRAWLYPRLGGVLPHIELVVANVGPGTAKSVRWWYEDVDREEWKARHIGGTGWPDGQKHAAGVDVMCRGKHTMKGRIQAVAAGMALALGIGVEAAVAQCSQPANPELVLETTRKGRMLVMRVRSNICGRNTLMLGVDLVGQKDTDIWIGKSERTELVNGAARYTIDLTGLPDGTYTAEAFWGWRFPKDSVAHAEAPTAKKVYSNRVEVWIAGTGTVAAQAQRRENKQMELMSSLGGNDPVPVDALARDFGPMEVLSENTRTRTLYFGGLDMTFEVTRDNRLRTYDRGRKEKKRRPSAEAKCPHGDEHTAWSFFQRAVKEHMTNPRSADFPWAGAVRDLNKIGQCMWTAQSWVEGENALGGTVRQSWNGWLRLVDGGAELGGLSFE